VEGKVKRLTQGRINVLAHRFLRGEPIPLFIFKADNYEIDKRVDEILAARRRRSYKRERDGQLMRGGLTQD
jgi:hypothetical protein